MTRRRQARRHGDNGGLRRRVVIAQVHQRRAELIELRLVHPRDVGKPGERGRGLGGHDVRGVPQVDHGPRELHQIVVRHAQLAGDGHDLGDVLGGRRHLRGHLLDRIGQRIELLLRSIHRLADRSEGALVVDGRFERGGTQRQYGRGDDLGHPLARLGQRLAHRVALLGKCRQRLARLCPSGLHAVQLLCELLDLRLGFPDGGLGVVEVRLGGGDGVGIILERLAGGHQLSLDLFYLGACRGVLLFEPLQIRLGHDRGGVRFPQRIRVLPVLRGGGLHLPPDALIFGTGIGQRGFQLFLPGIGGFQLVVRRHQRPGILLHRAVLLGKLLSQHGELRFRALDRLFELVDTGTGQLKGALRLLNLLVDGPHIAGKVVAVQRQRHHQLAQNLAHGKHLPSKKRPGGR